MQQVVKFTVCLSHQLQSLRVAKLQEVLGQLCDVEVTFTSIPDKTMLHDGSHLCAEVWLATGALFLGILRRLASWCQRPEKQKIHKENNVNGLIAGKALFRFCMQL